ncbi:defensin, isoforms B and C-like [Crassostrea virginica]
MIRLILLLVGLSLLPGPDAAAAERHKRLTCQLGTVSIGGSSIGNFGCYLHCVYLGYKGGYCNSQSVCNCTR